MAIDLQEQREEIVAPPLVAAGLLSLSSLQSMDEQ